MLREMERERKAQFRLLLDLNVAKTGGQHVCLKLHQGCKKARKVLLAPW